MGHITVFESGENLLRQFNVDLTNLLASYVKGDLGIVSGDAAWKTDTAIYNREGEANALYPMPDGRILHIRTRFCVTLTDISEYKTIPEVEV